MANNWWRWVVLAAAVVVVAGFWLWQTPGDPGQGLAALGLALTAIGGALWQYRIQAARRWRTALDAYAERALLARERRRQPKRSPARVT